jgi:hypothetical protein
MSLWSYCCLCADMADFASRDNNTCNFFPFSSLYFSITQTIVDITISIYAQKSTATDRYWWSFGPAKFESSTARFDAETRWAVSSSISALSWQIIYQNVDDYIVYHWLNRDVDTMTESYQNTVQNSGVLARRLVSWLEVGGVRCTVFLAGESGREPSRAVEFLRWKLVNRVEYFEKYSTLYATVLPVKTTK